MNVRDPVASCLRRTGWSVSLSVEEDLATVRRDQPGENVHQRAFSGTVLADEGMDLAGGYSEFNAVESDGRSETLSDVVELKERHRRQPCIRSTTPGFAILRS